MRVDPIMDPQGDLIVAQERADRALERADSPAVHLDVNPLAPCRDCGQTPHEEREGHWLCACGWSDAA